MINMDDFYMREALKEAKKAFQEDEVPVGAIIIHNDTIIARGYNMCERLKDPTAHAEILCIREASKKIKSERLINCKIFSTLEPCLMCASAISLARIEKVFFGAGKN